ncbi:MAG: TolB family protein [bacterium]
MENIRYSCGIGLLLIILLLPVSGAEPPARSEEDLIKSLPPYITRLTQFGERADWPHDGRRILFLEKTFGDVFEIDLQTRVIRPVTHHYYHEGYTRALYLANGDILLSGARTFDAQNPLPSRHSLAELWVLDRSLTQPPVPLGEKCSEGPAVSRKNLRIAWTIDHEDYPDRLVEGQSQIWMADLEYREGKPVLVNNKLVLDSTKLPFKTGLETQNFRPPLEKELIFSAYGYQGTEVMGVNFETGEIINYSQAPGQYDEPEGIFPDGAHTLVECDKHNRKGSQYIDIYKLRLDGSGETERLTFFNDSGIYKSSNPVVSEDGRFMAFQMARVEDMAGVGRGIFIYDFEKAKR